MFPRYDSGLMAVFGLIWFSVIGFAVYGLYKFVTGLF